MPPLYVSRTTYCIDESWLTGPCMEHRIDEDSPVSPGTVSGPSGPSYFSDMRAAPAKDRTMTGSLRDYRRELAALDNPSGNIPSISREPPSAPLAEVAPWTTEPSAIPSTARLPPARSFFDDRDENASSPPFRPNSARTDTSDSLDLPWRGDDRRPSVASNTTIGSQDSGLRPTATKGAYQKTLAGLFGEDVSGRTSQQGSDSSVPNSIHSHRRRNGSFQTNNANGRTSSPSGSRPQTPLPSSDVVPWVFQDFKVS